MRNKITKYVINGKDIIVIDGTGAILQRNVLKKGEEVNCVILESILLNLVERCSIKSLRMGDLSMISNKLLGVFEIKKRECKGKEGVRKAMICPKCKKSRCSSRMY